MEEKLRIALKEAKKKGKIGLLIWANQEAMDLFGHEVTEGKVVYDSVKSALQNNEEIEIPVKFYDYNLSGLIGYPVKKLISSEEYFQGLLEKCKKDFYKGPIFLFP